MSSGPSRIVDKVPAHKPSAVGEAIAPAGAVFRLLRRGYEKDTTSTARPSASPVHAFDGQPVADRSGTATMGALLRVSESNRAEYGPAQSRNPAFNLDLDSLGPDIRVGSQLNFDIVANCVVGAGYRMVGEFDSVSNGDHALEA